MSLWDFVGGASNVLLDKRKEQMARKIEEDRIRLMQELKLQEEQRAAERDRDRYLMDQEETARKERREDARLDRQYSLEEAKMRAAEDRARAQDEISRGYLANAQRQTSLAEAAANQPSPRGGPKRDNPNSVAQYIQRQIELLGLKKDEAQAVSLALAGAESFDEVNDYFRKVLGRANPKEKEPTSAIFIDPNSMLFNPTR